MAQISAIFFAPLPQRAIILYFSATATCATFFSLRQWSGGAKKWRKRPALRFSASNYSMYGGEDR